MISNEAKIITGIAVTTIVLLFGAVFFLSKSTPVSPKQSVDPAKLVTSDSHKIATPSAKLTIVEFGDFQCPACGAANEPIMKAFSEHQDQVTFVFRHFPLSQHRNAINGAKAVESAGQQGKFFEMDKLIYQKQLD